MAINLALSTRIYGKQIIVVVAQVRQAIVIIEKVERLRCQIMFRLLVALKPFLFLGALSGSHPFQPLINAISISPIVTSGQ